MMMIIIIGPVPFSIPLVPRIGAVAAQLPVIRQRWRPRLDLLLWVHGHIQHLGEIVLRRQRVEGEGGGKVFLTVLAQVE